MVSGTVAGVAASAGIETPAASTIEQNAAKGAASESRVLNSIGESKNTQAVTASEGKSIPDFQNSKVVGEIKDAKTVSNTRQLRIQKEAAQQSGREHQLVTGNKTNVTNKCRSGDESHSQRGPRAEMNGKKDCENLMNAVLSLAERMLRDYGEFYPYGGYMKLDGDIVHVGAKDEDTGHPKSKNLLYVLRDSFTALARAGECKASAIVFDVRIDLPASKKKSDAIQICLEHSDGYSAEVFFPYEIANGQVVYGATFAQEGKHEIFAS